MPAAILLLASLSQAADWIPARWPSGDPATLTHLTGSKINCLLLEKPNWSAPFVAKAAAMRISILGILRPGGDTAESLRTAKERHLAAAVLEGDFPAPEAEAARQTAGALDLPLIELPSRTGIRFGRPGAILGTNQGLWAGIRPVDENDKSHAAPSGGPWIETNSGFLRFARALHAGPFWIAHTPPEGQAIPADRYLQAIGDAAMTGARWVIALDPPFAKRLFAGEAAAAADWKKILAHAAFYENHSGSRSWPPYAQLAVLQDAASGALLSGSVLDMIGVKHTPVRPVPVTLLSQSALGKATMAVNLDPEGLSAAQKETLRAFQRAGGTVLNGPPGWRMPAASKNRLTVDEADVEKLDRIWKETNTMINRRNMGVRLFNVSSMLSYLQSSPDGKRAVLHLVNYSGYPVENVAAHVLGRYKKAWIELPDGTRKAIEPYEAEEGEGTGLELDLISSSAIITIEAN